MKKTLPIDKLVQWALVDELPKGHAVGISAWDAVISYSRLGARVDVSASGHGLGFTPGTPHPDAEVIAQALRALPDKAQLRSAECAALIGPYAALDPLAVRAVAAASFNPLALVIRCAALKCAMEWDLGLPHPAPVRHATGHVIVFGVVDGELTELRIDRKTRRYHFIDQPRTHLTYGTPSVGALLETRAEYTVWHRALVALAASLADSMSEHAAAPPLASPQPWRDNKPASAVHQTPRRGGAERPLPLHYPRPRAARPHESAIERKARQSRGRKGPVKELAETVKPASI